MPTAITPSNSDPALATYDSPIGSLTLAARGAQDFAGTVNAGRDVHGGGTGGGGAVGDRVDARLEVFVVAKSISDHAGTSIYIIDDGRFHDFAHGNFPLLQIRLEIGFEFRGECFKLLCGALVVAFKLGPLLHAIE